MKNSLLIFGNTGFVGKYLYNFFNSNETVVAFSRTGNFHFDLEKQEFPDHGFFKKSNAKFALIPAAVSKINICENEKVKSYNINVLGTLKLIELLAKSNVIPIWFSSDYVFDGLLGNYDESSKTNPRTEYGKQKEILEKEIPKITKGNYLIIRPGKVYSLDLNDNTLFSEIYKTLQHNNIYKAARNQIFNPTFIDDLVVGISKLMNLDAKGIFNICSSNFMSRYEVAIKIAKHFSFDLKNIISINIEELDSSLLRPKNTSMINEKFENFTNFKIRNFNSIIALNQNK